MTKIISNLWNKKLLFTFCFLLLNMIDFMRNSQHGHIALPAVNCTGLIIMVIIASAYPIHNFLNKINYIWTILCVLVLVGIMLSGRRFFFNDIHIWTMQTAILNIWWIVIFVRFFLKMIKEKTIVIRPNLLASLWILLTILMLISKNGRLWPIWFFILFGMFYLTRYHDLDRNYLMEGMMNGTILSFFCLQIFAYGFRPYDEVRYMGAFPNSNMNALHYLVVFCMVLLKLHLLEKRDMKKAWKLFYLMGAGGLLSFMVFTMCRTAWLVCIVMVLFYGIFVVKNIWNKKWLAVLTRGAGLLLAVVITFPLVFLTIRWLPTIMRHPIWHHSEYSEFKVHAFDPPDSPKYVEWEDIMDRLLYRIRTVIKPGTSFLVLQVEAATNEAPDQVENMEEGDSLVIRSRIYKEFLDHLSWRGHPQNVGVYIVSGFQFQFFNSREEAIASSASFLVHAHNVWLEIAFFYGIPAGIVFLVITMIILMKTFINMIQKKHSNPPVIPFLLIIMYFAFATIEINWLVGQMSLFLLFFVQHPQINDFGDSINGMENYREDNNYYSSL